MQFNYLMGAALAATVAISAPASAATFTLEGDTTGSPTYNRPLSGSPPFQLSGTGTAVAYDTLSFTVDATGSYSFLSIATSPDFDNYLGLHLGSFDPQNPLLNAIVYNDDYPTTDRSGFVVDLTAGQTYVAVMSGFDNGDFGTYTLTIDGPGSVLVSGAVPEPASWAMMIAGFGLVGGTLRRRAARTSVSFG